MKSKTIFCTVTACCNILEICLNVCDFLRAGLETNWVFLRTADGPKASVMVVSNAIWALEGKGQFSAAINFIEKTDARQSYLSCPYVSYYPVGAFKKRQPRIFRPKSFGNAPSNYLRLPLLKQGLACLVQSRDFGHLCAIEYRFSFLPPPTFDSPSGHPKTLV